MPHLPSLPADAVLSHVFRAYPAQSKELVEMSEAIMMGPSPLSIAERELIATYCCALNRCDYCYRTHRAVTEEFGVDGAVIDAVLDDLEAAPVDERMKPLLRYARVLTESPKDVTKDLVDAILAAGWDEAAVVHTAMACALFNFMTRLIEGTGLVGNEDAFAQAGKRFRESGYIGLVPMIEKAMSDQEKAG